MTLTFKALHVAGHHRYNWQHKQLQHDYPWDASGVRPQQRAGERRRLLTGRAAHGCTHAAPDSTQARRHD